MALVLNHVLTFIANGLNQSPADDVLKVCESFYTSDELQDAKTTLWEHGPKEILGENIRRKDSVKGSVNAKNLSDIVGGIQKLDAVGKVPHFVVDAEGLNRMPSLRNQVGASPASLQDLERLDYRMNSMDHFLREELDSLKCKIRQLEDVNTRPKTIDHCSPTSYPSYAATVATAAIADAPRPPAQSVSRDLPRPASIAGSKGPTGGDVPSSRDDGDAFTLVSRNKKKKKQRPHIVRCTGQAGVVRGAPEPSRDVHVFRCEKDVEEKHVEEHLRSKNITPRAVERVSKEASRFHSFRVEVALSCMQPIMSPDFWPDGVCVKRFYRPKRTSTNGDDISGDGEK